MCMLYLNRIYMCIYTYLSHSFDVVGLAYVLGGDPEALIELLIVYLAWVCVV